MITNIDQTEYSDAVHMAAQLGRLDFISALLAIIGFAMILGGIFTFFHYRNLAKKEAIREARIHAKEVAEEAANRYLQSELPNLLEEYANIFGFGTTTDDQANTIAEAQEEEE